MRLNDIQKSLSEIINAGILSYPYIETNLKDTIDYIRFKRGGVSSFIRELLHNTQWRFDKAIRYKNLEIWAGSYDESQMIPSSVCIMKVKGKEGIEDIAEVGWEDIPKVLPPQIVKKIRNKFITSFSKFPGASLSGTVDHKWILHKKYSKDCRSRFKSGDEEALFEFCKNDEWAFRDVWVVKQIETWKKRNTPDSRKKLRNLMKSFSLATGKTRRDVLYKYLQRDKEIYLEVSTMKRSNPKKAIDDCILDVTENRIRQEEGKIDEKQIDGNIIDLKWRKAEYTREIYWKFKKIKNSLDVVLYMYREEIIGIPQPPLLQSERFDIVLKDAFKLDKIIKSLDKEVKLYKEMRFLLERAEYESGKSLHRRKNITLERTGKDHESIYKEILKREKSFFNTRTEALVFLDALSYIRKLYLDFRKCEAFLNHENFEEIMVKEGLRVG